MKKLLVLCSLLFIGTWCFAQPGYTTVSATITDPSGQAWSNGVYAVDYQRPSNNQGTIPTILGANFTEHGLGGTLDNVAHFTIPLPDVTKVLPAGGQWVFTICPNASSQCFIIPSGTNVQGVSANLSTFLNGQISNPAVATVNINRAYKDSEVTPTRGGFYYDVTLNCLKFSDGVTFSCVGTGGMNDPGSNGILKRIALNTTAIAGSTDIISTFTGICNGSTALLGNGSCGSLNGIAPIVTTSSQTGATSDVRITNAITALPTGGIVWANDSTAQSWAACPTFGTQLIQLVLFPVTYSVAVNCSIPANIMLEFSNGAVIAPANATTTTILGVVLAGRQQIFNNALAGQGTISFTTSTKVSVLYPEWFGAKKDSVTNDLPALQAVADVAGAAINSTPGPSIIDLGCGIYKTVGQWTIASSTGQHHVIIRGVSPLCTTINATVGASPATAIFLSKEKYVPALSGFTLHQAGTLHNGIGITMGGLTGSGTQTNGSTLDNIGIDSFDTGLLTTDPITASTSSEMIFSQMTFSNNNTGFVNSSQNGLDYVFIMAQMSNNTLGMNLADSGVTVLGGSGSNNGTDFQFLSGAAPSSVVKNYRSEVATTQCVNMAGDTNVSLEEFTCQGLSTPTSHTAITQGSAGLLEIKNSFIGGQVVETARGSLSIKNSRILDPNNTWSPTNQVAGMGPGFRMNTSIVCGPPGSGTLTNTCAHYSVINTYIIDAFVAIQYQISSASGWMSTGVSGGTALAIPTTPSIQGPTLTISSNAITPTAYVHHIGTGLLKNINLLTNPTYPLQGSVNWELNCIQLIADANYTTDTTGNIAVAMTASTNQVITWCLDPLTTKWYPESGSGVATSFTATAANGGFSGVEGTGAAVICGAGIDCMWPDSTAHRWIMNNNGGGAQNIYGTKDFTFTNLTDTPGAITVNAQTCTDRSVAMPTILATATITLSANYALDPNIDISSGQAQAGTGAHYRICNVTGANITLNAAAAFSLRVIQ